MSHRSIALAGFGLGLLALAVAFGAEYGLKLIPCAMCLAERWPYRLAMLAAIGVFAAPAGQRWALAWVMIAIFAGAAATAFVHVGVEQHWWASPFPECMAPDLSGLSPAERFARMPLHPSKSCEDADYLIPWLPVTMAQANLAYALASVALLTMWMRRVPRHAA